MTVATYFVDYARRHVLNVHRNAFLHTSLKSLVPRDATVDDVMDAYEAEKAEEPESAAECEHLWRSVIKWAQEHPRFVIESEFTFDCGTPWDRDKDGDGSDWLPRWVVSCPWRMSR